MKTEIIYEDKDLIVIKKPAGLATQSAKVGQPDVVSELKNYLAGATRGKGQPPYLGVIHRLDQPVEGLLVFAKNKNTAAALTGQLSEQKADGLFNKQYYAVFCGKPAEKEGTLVDDMYKGADGRAVIGKSQESKRAVLNYRVVEGTEASSEELCLADICIETGRFHQIRAQMAHREMPLLGDVKYGSEISKACSKKFGISTVALCAYRLSFSHPATGKQLHFEIKPATKAFSYFNL